jgi:hypothetical protein
MRTKAVAGVRLGVAAALVVLALHVGFARVFGPGGLRPLDAVSLGARPESLNKEYGTRIIISDATRRQLTGRCEVRPLGAVGATGRPSR